MTITIKVPKKLSRSPEKNTFTKHLVGSVSLNCEKGKMKQANVVKDGLFTVTVGFTDRLETNYCEVNFA